MKGIISIFMNARPVTMGIGSVLFVSRSAIRDMIWFIIVILTTFANVEVEEMNFARYGNKGCRVFKGGGGTKLERFLPKNQHTQRKLLNFENWVNGKVSKIEHHFSNKVI